MKRYILGIDTSAYTTSCAISDNDGNIIESLKKNLIVADGKKGLRQQEAVFMHLKNLPELLEKLNINFQEIGIVSVSNRPRNVDGSYMPVFTVGQNFAKIIAKSVSAKYIEYSHQENHIAAGLINTYKTSYKDLLAIHISGGTTEFMLAEKDHKGFRTELIGGTKDITFGQLIDRIGVYYGMPFPSGTEMQRCLDTYELNFEEITKPKVSLGNYLNLSGIENYYKRMIDEGRYSKESIIYSLFDYISDCIKSIIDNIINVYNIKTIVISGGVSSNSYIRDSLYNYYNDIDIIFPERKYSADNSIGNAVLPVMDRWYNEIKAN